DRRHHASDAGDSGALPVGGLSTQPRRAHARDGDRRRARLHVPRVRARSADAHQRRHTPAPRSADGERPPPDGADERAAHVHARHADHLLRRRDRHGRQHLPWRPERRSHPDALERRPQRRVQRSRHRGAFLTAHRQSAVRLSHGQRRRTGARAHVAPPLDAPTHCGAPAVPRLRPRHLGADRRRQSARPHLSAPLQRRAHSLRQQPLALRTVRRARPPRVHRPVAARALEQELLSADWRASISPHPRPAQLSLVPAAPPRAGEGIPALHVSQTEHNYIEGVSPDDWRRFLDEQRWYMAKAARPTDIRVAHVIALPWGGGAFAIAIVDVAFDDRVDRYQIAVARRDAAPSDIPPHAMIHAAPGAGVLYDAVFDGDFRAGLGLAIANGATAHDGRGAAWTVERARSAAEPSAAPAQSSVASGEQSNTSLIFDDSVILKLFRTLKPGVQPDVEVTEFLTTHTSFANTPPLVAVITLEESESDERATAGMAQRFLPG